RSNLEEKGGARIADADARAVHVHPAEPELRIDVPEACRFAIGSRRALAVARHAVAQLVPDGFVAQALDEHALAWRVRHAPGRRRRGRVGLPSRWVLRGGCRCGQDACGLTAAGRGSLRERCHRKKQTAQHAAEFPPGYPPLTPSAELRHRTDSVGSAKTKELHGRVERPARSEKPSIAWPRKGRPSAVPVPDTGCDVLPF